MASTCKYAAAVAAVAALLAPAAAHAAPGDLDPTFDGDGRLTADLAPTDKGNAVLYQPDGKLIVAGATGKDLVTDFAVLRFNADGTPDKTFDGDGRATIPFGPRDEAKALALGPDGSIVVAGDTDADASQPGHGSFSLAVTRLDSRGQIDTTFVPGVGRQVVDFGGQELAEDVAVQSDGKIVITGGTLGGSRATADAAWARLEKNGDLDKTFDGDGRATFDHGGSESTASTEIAPDGSIVTAGSTTAGTGGGRDFTVYRLTSAGASDSTFSGDGLAQVGFGDSDDLGAGLGIQPDGGIVVGGQSFTVTSGDFTAARLTPQGELDPSYGNGGRGRIPGDGLEVARDVTLSAEGELVIAGATFANGALGDFAAGLLLPDGTPDPRFGGGRAITVDVAGSPEQGNAAATRDGALAIAGTTGGDIGVAQLVLPRAGDPLPQPPVQPGTPEQPQQQPPAPPAADTAAPVVSKLKLSSRRFSARKGARGSFKLSEPARVTLTIQRRRGRRLVKAGALKVQAAKAGTNKFKLGRIGRKRLARGGYCLTATAIDQAGNKSTAARITFRVR